MWRSTILLCQLRNPAIAMISIAMAFFIAKNASAKEYLRKGVMSMRAFSPKGKRIAIERGLQQKLQEPSRYRLEEEFARKNAECSDEELFLYVKEQKRAKGKRMTRANTIGYCYLVERLGPWDCFMSRIVRELEQERRQQ